MDLTIVIPTCNRKRRAIECVASLAPVGAEILVVDDGASEPVVVPRARVIRHDRNRGRAAAVNTGLRGAAHDLVLILDDDIYATEDMVALLVEEFRTRKNSKLALVGRVIWDPKVPLTPAMKWLEETGPLCEIASTQSGTLDHLSTRSTLLWKPFVLEHGGFDEGFTRRGLEDVELGLRLKRHGLDIRLLASAVGHHHKVMKIRDLINWVQAQGMSAVDLHSRFPQYVPQVDDTDTLLKNERQAADAASALEELGLIEESGSSSLPAGGPELIAFIYRHHFFRGILNGLRETGSVKLKNRSNATLAIYDQASILETMGELDEARRLFRLVLHRNDQEYWADAEFHLGRIESILGNARGARDHFKQCVLLNPAHAEAVAALNART